MKNKVLDNYGIHISLGILAELASNYITSRPIETEGGKENDGK